MSLSDYSSDDSLEEEEQAAQQIPSRLRRVDMNSKKVANSDAGPSSMLLGALAALAVAGVAAGSLYARQYFAGRKHASKDSAQEEPRKDLRRKRGDVRESPRRPFMARTESASSVGPLRKQPRRDTSEESEGGEASGSSPTAGQRAGRPKTLRKTPSSRSRHKRPPVRAAAFETPKEDAKEECESALEAGTAEEQLHSRAGEPDQEAAPVSQAPVHAAEPGPAAGPAASLPAAEGSHAANDTAAAAAPTASPAAVQSVQEAPRTEEANKSASQSSLPDLLGKPLSSSTCTQPSLDTFTADCDVLDSALENVNAEHTSSGKEQANEQQDGKKQASTPPSVKEGPKKEATAPERRVEEPALAGGAPAEGADSSAAGQAEARESKLEAEKILESADKPAQKAAKAKAGQGAGSENASKSAEAGAREASARTHSSSESKPEQAAAPREIQTETEVGSERGTAGEDQEVANLPKNGASAPDTDDRSKVGVSESKGEDQKQHSRPQSSEAAAAGSKRSQEAEAEGQGRAAAPVSDEQTAVMERGGSLMEEADQHDPEGIQLVRHMQAEVDKQDDLPDFSKTDAHRSAEAQKAETQTGGQDKGHEESKAAAASGKENLGEESAQAPKQSEEELKEPSAGVAEPSPRLMADTTPESDQLDLSSAEVATVTNIATADEEDGTETMEAQKEEPASTEAAKEKPEGAEQQAEKPREEATAKSKEADEAASAGGKPAAESVLSEPTAGEPTEEAPAKSEEPDLAESTANHAAKEPASFEQQVPGEQKSQDSVKELSPPAASAPQQDMAQPQSRGPAGTNDDVPEMKPSKGKEFSAAQADEHTRPEATISANAATGSKLNGAVEHSEGVAASKAPTDTAERPAGQLPVTGSEAAEDALKAVALPGKAPFDPLGMDAAEEGLPAPEVAPGKEAAVEAPDAELKPQNNTERDINLNLAVALRMIEERGNVAGAERTLQKQLAATRDSADSVRPDFRQRLAGTLADVIARAVQQDAAASKHGQTDRMPEIIDHLQSAFDCAKASGDASRSREAWRLGTALIQAGRLDEAKALFTEEVAHSEEQLGIDSPNTQQSRAYLADVLAKQGHTAEAYRLLSEASQRLEASAKTGGKSQPDGAADEEAAHTGMTPQANSIMSAAKCSVLLANMQEEQGEHREAEASARRAVQLMEAEFGEENPRNATAYGTLAAILKHIGEEDELREAIWLYERMQKITEDIHGIRNGQNALGLRAIADVHLMLKEYAEAISCLEKSLQIAGSVHGRNHPVMESFWLALAEAKTEAGDKQGAKDANRQALLVKSHAHRPGGAPRSPREGGAPRRGRGRSRR